LIDIQDILDIIIKKNISRKNIFFICLKWGKIKNLGGFKRSYLKNSTTKCERLNPEEEEEGVI
jgi:hypothetical protein